MGRAWPRARRSLPAGRPPGGGDRAAGAAGRRRAAAGGAMRPVDADEAQEPELDGERVRSPALAAARRDVSALEREHVRAHLRARRRLREIESLLDAIHSEVEASGESALDPARSPGAEAEERVVKLCEQVEKKAAEAALMGKRIVEIHQQIDSRECC